MTRRIINMVLKKKVQEAFHNSIFHQGRGYSGLPLPNDGTIFTIGYFTIGDKLSLAWLLMSRVTLCPRHENICAQPRTADLYVSRSYKLDVSPHKQRPYWIYHSNFLIDFLHPSPKVVLFSVMESCRKITMNLDKVQGISTPFSKVESSNLHRTSVTDRRCCSSVSQTAKSGSRELLSSF